MAFSVYLLTDPRTNLVRYVGYTSKTLEARLREHCQPRNMSRQSYVTCWFRSLLSQNLKPILSVHCVVNHAEEAKRVEIALIAKLLNEGVPLTNGTAGGDGVVNPTQEVRNRISAIQKGRPSPKRGVKGKPLSEDHPFRTRDFVRIYETPSEDTRIRMSVSASKRQSSEETRAKIAEGLRKAYAENRRSRIVSDETRQKISAHNRASSPEVRARMSAAKRGKKQSDKQRHNTSLAITNWWRNRKESRVCLL